MAEPVDSAPITAVGRGGAQAVRLRLHITPSARRTALTGRHGDRLKLTVAAPPADGKANVALLKFLSKRLGVPRDAIRITSGMSGRRKTVVIDGVDLLTAKGLLGC